PRTSWLFSPRTSWLFSPVLLGSSRPVLPRSSPRTSHSRHRSGLSCRSMRRCLVAVALALIVLSPSLLAWGGVGHHVVARIALSRLTPATQQAVTSILGTEDFVLSATWADEVRSARPESYNWHFVDIPYAETKYDAARDCPATERG